MNLEIITKADLEQAKRDIAAEVIEEVRKILNGTTEPEFIKTNEVKRILGCSDSKVETLRRNGKLQSYKLQGTVYYKTADIKKLFENLD